MHRGEARKTSVIPEDRTADCGREGEEEGRRWGANARKVAPAVYEPRGEGESVLTSAYVCAHADADELRALRDNKR